MKKMMSTKLAMAKFLRDSIAESGAVSRETSGDKATAAQEFASFFKKVGVRSLCYSCPVFLPISAPLLFHFILSLFNWNTQ